MKRISIACLAFAVNIFSAAAFGATGEFWEITSKMEMKGMPFAMPAQTIKVCLPPGGEKDPKRTQDKKSNCEMTDVKTSGNKVSYKGKCTSDGTTMNMEGENTYERDSYHGTMHMTGKSQGQYMDMSTAFNGKRIGGSCNTEEKIVSAQEKEIKGKMDQMCDTSDFDASKWISSSSMFIGQEPMCKGKKDALCDAVRKDAPRDADVYQLLVSTEKNNGNLITKTCGLNMDATTRTLCKTINGKNYSKLTAHCPAEAKAYKEAARKKYCEGRDYTAPGDLNKCLSGQGGGDNADEDAAKEAQSKGEADKSKSNNPAQPVIDGTKKLNTDSVIDGAKKLKGMFGF